MWDERATGARAHSASSTSASAFEALARAAPDKALALVDALLAQRSLGHFIRQAWHVEHGGTPIVWTRLHDVLVEHLEAVARGEIRRLIINVPPGTAKSLFVSVYLPAWVWLSRPSYKWLCVSGTGDVVTRDARRMRDTVESAWYQRTLAALGGTWQLRRQTRALTYFLNSANGARISRSTGQKIIGLRGDAILLDDPIDARELSQERLSASNDWFDTSLYNRRTHVETSPIVLIMQRLAEDDTTGHLLRRSGWTLLRLPALFEPEHACAADWRSEPGELLIPEILPAAELTHLRDEQLGPIGFAAQYQQRPAPADGAIFRREWLKYWTSEPPKAEKSGDPASLLPDRPEKVVISGDMTYKDTRHSHYCVGQIWALHRGKAYLWHQMRARLDLAGAKAAFAELVIKARQGLGRCDSVLIERTANGPAVIEHLKTRVGAAGVIGIDVGTRSKQERASLASVRCEAGDVYLPPYAGHPWVASDLEPELLSFPASRYDDQVDAFSQVLVWSADRAAPWVASLSRR